MCMPKEISVKMVWRRLYTEPRTEASMFKSFQYIKLAGKSWAHVRD